MPAQYEKIRDREVARGMPYDTAQSIAAATYNTQHPDAPVTGHAEAPHAAVHQHLRQQMRRHALLKQMGTK
jgi:hypothetical protein